MPFHHADVGNDAAVDTSRRSRRSRRTHRLIATAGAAALTVGALPLTVGSAVAAPAPAPVTAFEASGGAEWTTLEQEQEFLTALADGSSRVGVTTVATTEQGRPIQLVQIGNRQRTAGQLAPRATTLITCLQHGNEPAAREGCFQSMRNLAFDDSRETRQFLARHTVLFVPTVNPDGRAANTRQNADGVDVNRDHLALETLEAQTLAKIVRDYDPEIVQDAHEYGGRADLYERDLIRLWPRNLNVDPALRARGVELAEQYIDPAVTAGGWTTGVYGIYNGPDGEPVAQVAGDGDERIARNMMGLKHTVGQLTESQTRALTAAEQADPTVNQLRRVETQVLANDGALAMAEESGQDLVRETNQAERSATRLGARGEGFIRLGGADNVLPDTSQLILDPPCSYTLTGEQYDEIADTLALHDIAVRRSGTGVSVSMGQPARGIIPLLLDERALYPVIVGTPVACS